MYKHIRLILPTGAEPVSLLRVAQHIFGGVLFAFIGPSNQVSRNSQIEVVDPGPGAHYSNRLAAVVFMDGVDVKQIEDQLERILASPSFRNSRRHTQFLIFLVEKTLSGKSSEIKERLIGIEIFERPPDYDLASDPIVRGAAVELRKRLAQYYANAIHANELRLELPLGGYVLSFYWPNQMHNESQELATSGSAAWNDGIGTETAIPAYRNRLFKLLTKHRSLKTGVAIASALILAIAACAYYRITNADNRALDAFWAPLMNGSKSITVCVGDLNGAFASDQLKALPPIAQNPLNPNEGAALLMIGNILGSRGKGSILRLADLTELSDLRQQPTIFVGGFNNPWTLRILSGLRFQMVNIDYGRDTIADQMHPAMRNWVQNNHAPVDSVTRDYSLVTRMMQDPLTGQPVVLLSGIGPFGNSAASEFVSKPADFAQFSRSAPKGWENRTVQIVLETTVVNGKISVPKVIAEQVY